MQICKENRCSKTDTKEPCRLLSLSVTLHLNLKIRKWCEEKKLKESVVKLCKTIGTEGLGYNAL